MSFVNEKTSSEDKQRISSVITYEKIRALVPWVPRFSEPFWWTVERDRGAYLYYLTGGGPDQLPYYVLGLNEQAVVFNVENKSKGKFAEGVNWLLYVYDLRIPTTLEPRREEIKQLIREGLKEEAYANPLGNGGTLANPDFVTRRKILSFNVEF